MRTQVRCPRRLFQVAAIHHLLCVALRTSPLRPTRRPSWTESHGQTGAPNLAQRVKLAAPPSSGLNPLGCPKSLPPNPLAEAAAVGCTGDSGLPSASLLQLPRRSPAPSREA